MVLVLTASFSLTALGATGAFYFWIIRRTHGLIREGAAEHGGPRDRRGAPRCLIWGVRMALGLLLGRNARASYREPSPNDRRAYWELALRQHIAASVAVALMFAGTLIAVIVSFANELLR